MTHSVLGGAAAAVAITAVLAGTAQGQRASAGTPRLVLGEGRALIISAPATAVKVQPTIREIPRTQSRTGPRPATSFRPVPWPDRAAMFKNAGILVMSEDSSNYYSLAWNETIDHLGRGALWTSPSNGMRPGGTVVTGAEVTVGAQGQFAREHPSLQLHFYVQDFFMTGFTVHNLIDGSDIEVPTKSKAPMEIVVLVNVPANLVTDDKLNVVYGLVTLATRKASKPTWDLQRVDVLPVSVRVIGPGT